MISLTRTPDRSKMKATLLASVIAAALASPTFAQTAEESDTNTGSQTSGGASQQSTAPSGTQAGERAAAQDESEEGEIIAEQRGDQILVQDLLGMEVVNGDGKSLGTLENVVLDQDGQVAGIVLARGGFLGIGAKPVGIAWSDLAKAANAEVLTLNLTPEEVDKAPEFKTKAEKLREEQRKQKAQQQMQQQTGTGDGLNQ